MGLTKMELIITQNNDNGMFGGPYISDFEYTYKGVLYRAIIEQGGIRKIQIGTDIIGEPVDLLIVETFLEQVLFLFDGRFYHIKTAEIIDEKEKPEIHKNIINKYFNNRLPIYSSLDICKYSFMRLINYKDVDFKKVMIEWSKLSEELDIAFNMFQYCLSDIPMPVDCKISSIIEMVKPIDEILEKSNNSFRIERNRKHMSLKKALDVTIKTFGDEIFEKELAGDFQEFLKSLVDTRNKISHVKSERGERCLDRGQCKFYIAKLSILYRKIIFMLLGIDKALYTDNIINAVKKLDDWYYEDD